jgi:nicotinamidase-related amidase
VIIDIQRDYFPGGAYPLVEPDAAAQAAQRLLGAYRTAGAPVIHVQHVWDAPDAAFMKPGTDGVEIHPLVAPEGTEPVVTKAFPNSFVETDLEAQLRDRGIDSVVIAGMMTSMCVDSTTRPGAELGFTLTVVHDACAAPDLTFGDSTVPGASVHAAFLAALGDGFATVVSSDEAVAAVAGSNA